MSPSVPLVAEAGRGTLRALKRTARAVGITRGRAAAARMATERYALAVGGRTRVRPGGRILCYHSLGEPSYGVNDVSPARFRRQIETALRAGYRFVPAEAIAETGGAPHDLAITFDDACKSVLTVGAPILSALGLPWSLFVVSGWCEAIGTGRSDAYLSWQEVEALAAAGARIGSHSVTHPDFGRLAPDQAADELVRSRETIGRRLGIVPTSFAIPLGQSMNWSAAAGRLAREAGYRTVYAQAEETRPAGTVARTFVTRFDDAIVFRGLLRGRFDAWEEWV
ncbi:polysaccharide deacetylase [Methylobacterium radiotolerans]|uniref:polysaccharide deacetylase family protein n=1 Tax=Methylobacterium radiotolerans TaxID=31998 RepID=UPI002F2F64B2